MKKFAYVLLTLCAVAFLSFNTIQAAPRKVTINFWHNDNDADAKDLRAQWMSENLELFKKANPDIEVVETNVANGDQYLTKITTEMAANNAPDIFQTWLSGRLEPFVKAGRIYPLNSEIDKDPNLKNILVPANLKNGTFDGKIYALPNIVTSELLFYNKEIFAKYGLPVPKTWDDFIAVIKKLKANGVIPLAMPNKDPWVGTIPYMYIFDRIAGPNKWEETCVKHTGKFTEPEYATAAKKLLELRDAGAFPENFNSLDYNEGKVLFTSGKAAMYMMGTWELGSLIGTMGDKLDFFSFPVIANGKGSSDGYILSQDNAYAISNNSQNKAAAVKFLKFMFSKERQAVFAEYGFLITTKDIPYNKSKVPALTVKVIQTLGAVKSGFLPWDNPLGVNVGKELNNSTQLILAGADIKDTFEKLEKLNESEFGLKK
jgi:ABC-type glycerol-3-phosphate transport system substrate-binding protein